MKRTDLIFETAEMKGSTENGSVHGGKMYGTRFSEVNISTAADGLTPGRYITLFTGKGDIRACLTSFISSFLPEGSILIAGLGNENICSDSLGVKALKYIPATAHLAGHKDFRELGLRKVYVLEAGVTGKTGIESSGRVSCIAEYVGAAAVIAIDSLACADIGRLCTTVQITDTGISPGSGVGNDRKALNSETVGVPVIAIGVPTVIDLESITESGSHSGLMVTPRNIDILSDRLAETIGISVSRALNPALSEAELRSLILL